jgi:hypothetical protein
MQSMLPSITENPLTALCAIIWAVPSAVGDLKYSSRNTSTTAHAEPRHALNGSTLNHAHAVIMFITRSSIGKNSQSSCALLDRGKTSPANTVFLANEVGIELPEVKHNLHKKLPVHPETALKYHIVVKWIIGKVLDVQHAVTL